MATKKFCDKCGVEVNFPEGSVNLNCFPQSGVPQFSCHIGLTPFGYTQYAELCKPCLKALIKEIVEPWLAQEVPA